MQGLNKLNTRLAAYGGRTAGDIRVYDQWTRMRQDKLRSMKQALLYSYQAAVVQTYDAVDDRVSRNIINVVTDYQNNKPLTENQKLFMAELEVAYPALVGVTDKKEIINILNEILKEKEGLYFRALINHDKLKVDYEDKIISIPYQAVPLESIDPVKDGGIGVEPTYTNFHNGTVFKWIHGNKEQWIQDSYWIVYMQYSEETAYFRGEIRRADEEIVIQDENGNEYLYRGWSTGPNEKEIIWNVKKNVVWNDMFYTKLLYITKDDLTQMFFKRFDRVKINGQPWEIQAINTNYGSSASNQNTGIIRVALKETYASTDDMIAAEKQEIQKEKEEEKENLIPRIVGPTQVYPYDKYVYELLNDAAGGTWSVSDTTLARITAQTKTKCMVQIVASKGVKKSFDIKCGEYTLTIPKIMSM